MKLGDSKLKIRASVEVPDPEKAALLFSAILAADKGYTSRIVRGAGSARLVIASDGQAVRFLQK